MAAQSQMLPHRSIQTDIRNEHVLDVADRQRCFRIVVPVGGSRQSQGAGHQFLGISSRRPAETGRAVVEPPVEAAGEFSLLYHVRLQQVRQIT